MAVTPNTDEAFLREVDEGVRRDQMIGVWQNYGRLIIGAIALGLVIFAGVIGWRNYTQSQQEQRGIKLQQVYDSMAAGNAANAKASIDELVRDGGGYGAMGKMLQANKLLTDGNAKAAAAKFAEVANDTTLGQPIRDLALIRQTFTEFDILAPQAIVDRLKPMVTKDSAWLGSAGEMTAMAYLRLNKPAEARKIFQMIAGAEQVPDSIRQRAVQAVDAVDAGANDQKGK